MATRLGVPFGSRLRLQGENGGWDSTPDGAVSYSKSREKKSRILGARRTADNRANREEAQGDRVSLEGPSPGSSRPEKLTWSVLSLM